MIIPHTNNYPINSMMMLVMTINTNLIELNHKASPNQNQN